MRLPRLVGYHRDLLQSFFGRLGFLNTGCFGKLGRAGLNTLKERQCSQDTALTDELSRSFEEIRSLLALKPERELPLQPIHQQRYLAASDEPRQGSAGLLFVGPRCRRQTCRSTLGIQHGLAGGPGKAKPCSLQRAGLSSRGGWRLSTNKRLTSSSVRG